MLLFARHNTLRMAESSARPGNIVRLIEYENNGKERRVTSLPLLLM
jgi:hypothetical protein